MITRLQFAAFFLLIAAAPATQPIFQETSDGKLSDGWSWLREDTSAWSIKDHALHLNVSTGSLWEKANSAKNVLLRDLPGDSDICVEVTATSSPKDQAEQATILWFVDEDNYVKLCKEMMNGKQNVVLAREENAKGTWIAGHAVDAATIRLRLTRRDNSLLAYYSTDEGATWTQVGGSRLPAGKSFKVGLVAHGANSGDAREATFKEFRIGKSEK
jgi:regulation of enolase protein 1 (concanavalin A-like superfamily)